MADATWSCCRLGARSVFTIQPCASLQCYLIQSHSRRVDVCLAVTCLLHFGRMTGIFYVLYSSEQSTNKTLVWQPLPFSNIKCIAQSQWQPLPFSRMKCTGQSDSLYLSAVWSVQISLTALTFQQNERYRLVWQPLPFSRMKCTGQSDSLYLSAVWSVQINLTAFTFQQNEGYRSIWHWTFTFQQNEVYRSVWQWTFTFVWQ